MSAFALNSVALDVLAPSVPLVGTRSLFDRYLSAATELLARSGYGSHLKTDLQQWAHHLRAAPGNTGVNPTFDPSWHNEIEAGSAFWIAVTDDAEAVVACMACRLFATRSYYDLMRSGRLWYTAGKAAPVDLHLDGAGPVGRVSHSGGLWVHPDHRGEGLSWILPRLIGGVAVQAWSIDYHTGIVFAGLNSKGVPDKNYGVSRNRLAIDGYFAPTGRHEVIFSVETPVADIVERTHADLAQILGDPDKKVRDLAPIAKQRRDIPAVSQHAVAEARIH